MEIQGKNVLKYLLGGGGDLTPSGYSQQKDIIPHMTHGVLRWKKIPYQIKIDFIISKRNTEALGVMTSQRSHIWYVSVSTRTQVLIPFSPELVQPL